jgi:hypothetical protein
MPLPVKSASVFPGCKPGTKQPGQVSMETGGFRYSPENQAFDFCRLFGRLSARERRQNSRIPAQDHFCTTLRERGLVSRALQVHVVRVVQRRAA